MERIIKIKVDQNKWTHGVLRGNLKQPLILFVHGLTGSRDEHIFYNGARFFEQHGFSTFRFNLYDWVPKTRKLKECTLALHGKDIDTVVQYFKKRGVKKIGASGHSYGGPSLLFSNHTAIDALVLWDPSYNPPRLFKEVQYVPQLKQYHEQWACGILIGKHMVEEARSLTPKACNELAQKVTTPLKVISAGKGILKEGGQRYSKAASGPSEHTTIKKANHCFDVDGTEEKLFDETLKWFKKYLK